MTAAHRGQRDADGRERRPGGQRRRPATTGNEGTAVQLNGSVTDAGANDTHTWSWKYVAGAGVDAGRDLLLQRAPTAEDPTVTCTDDGEVELTLKVTDDDGGERQSTQATLTAGERGARRRTRAAPTPATRAPRSSSSGSATDKAANDMHQLQVDRQHQRARRRRHLHLRRRHQGQNAEGHLYRQRHGPRSRSRRTDDDGGLEYRTRRRSTWRTRPRGQRRRPLHRQRGRRGPAQRLGDRRGRQRHPHLVLAVRRGRGRRRGRDLHLQRRHRR